MHDKQNSEEILAKIGTFIEYGVLISLILLNALDFLGLLTEEMDYAKKIISWTGLIIVLKEAKLSTILFGFENKLYDIYFPISLFILSFKDFLAFSMIAAEEFSGILSHFMEFLASNFYLIEVYSIYIGLILLLFFSYFVFKNKDLGKKNCVFSHISNNFFSNNFFKFSKILIIHFVFYTIFFSMFIEWLAISVDSAVFILVLLMFIFYRKHFESDTIDSLSSFAEEFYEKTIRLFRYKNGLSFGYIYMLILHLLTDIGIFIIPIAMYVSNPLYIENLDPELHMSLFSQFELFLRHSFSLPILRLGVSIVGLLVFTQFLVYPLVIFISRLKNKKLEMHPALISFFYSSLVSFLIIPSFFMKPILSSSYAGVDILHTFIRPGDFRLLMFYFAFIVTFVFCFKMIKLSDKFFKSLSRGIEVMSSVFVFVYFLFYVISYSDFLLRSILFFNKINFVLFLFFAFFVLTKIIFYIYSVFKYFKFVFVGYDLTSRNLRRYTKRSQNNLHFLDRLKK